MCANVPFETMYSIFTVQQKRYIPKLMYSIDNMTVQTRRNMAKVYITIQDYKNTLTASELYIIWYFFP
jgi:hypothetical protein